MSKTHIPQRSRAALLSGVLGPAPPTYVFKNPKRRHIRQVAHTGPLTPPTGCKGAAKPIAFDFPADWKQGIPFPHVSKMASAMAGSGDLPFGMLGIDRIELCLAFPGYEHLDFCQTLTVGRRTRAEIAILVVQVYADFVARATPDQKRTNSPELIFHKNIHWEMLVLLELSHYDGDMWQVNLAYDAK